jgi:hypothetical protein
MVAGIIRLLHPEDAMGRKRKGDDMQGAAKKTGKDARYVRLELTTEEHALLRRVAAHHDASMVVYARRVVSEAVSREAARLGIALKGPGPAG